MNYGSWGIRCGIFALLTLASQPYGSAATKDVDVPRGDRWKSYEPNYADVMLSPIDGSDEPPRLFPARPNSLIHVGIVDDGVFCCDGLESVVRDACETWARATKGVPDREISFDYLRAPFPKGADIVIRFGRRRDLHGFQGFTNEERGYAMVSIAVLDEQDRQLSPARIRRIVLHEIGHALGIWGHSPDPKDIMSLDPDTKEISVSDVNTLRLAYRR